MITDIVIIGLIVIIALTGWRRGLLMSVISFAMTLISLAAVWFILGPVTSLLERAPFLTPISEKIDETLVVPLQQAGNSVTEAAAGIGLPPVAEALLVDRFSEAADNQDAWQELSAIIFRMTLSAGLFLLLFAVIMTVVIVAGHKITKLMDKLPLLGLANRTAGLLVSLLLILLVIHAVIYGAALISPLMPAAGEWIENSRVLSWFYQSELWQGLLDTIFS